MAAKPLDKGSLKQQQRVLGWAKPDCLFSAPC